MGRAKVRAHPVGNKEPYLSFFIREKYVPSYPFNLSCSRFCGARAASLDDAENRGSPGARCRSHFHLNSLTPRTATATTTPGCGPIYITATPGGPINTPTPTPKPFMSGHVRLGSSSGPG